MKLNECALTEAFITSCTRSLFHSTRLGTKTLKLLLVWQYNIKIMSYNFSIHELKFIVTKYEGEVDLQRPDLNQRCWNITCCPSYSRVTFTSGLRSTSSRRLFVLAVQEGCTHSPLLTRGRDRARIFHSHTNCNIHWKQFQSGFLNFFRNHFPFISCGQRPWNYAKPVKPYKILI